MTSSRRAPGRRHRSTACALLFALAASPVPPAHAASVPHWAREAIAATAAATDAAPARVLLDRTEIHVDRDLGAEFRWRRVVRIGAGGTAFAALHVMIEPGGKLEDVQAWTITGDEARATAGRAQAIDQSVSSEGYSDVRITTLPAPDAHAGDCVAFEASWTESEPFPLYEWWPQRENLPVAHAELELALPHGWSSSVHGYHVATPTPTPGDHESLSLTDLPALPDEARRPADSALLPRVLVRFESSPGRGPFARWDSLAAWFGDLSASSTRGDRCPAEIAALTANGSTTERIAAAARAVQERVRYVAIELGMQRWVPDAAGDTWERRYGDCKDKAALLVSALRSIGVEAEPMLVCTRDRWNVDPDSPDPFQFNHCIVAFVWPGADPPAAATLRDAGGRAWTIFDPTDEGVPLGAVSDALGGTWGVIAGRGAGLARLPDPTVSTRSAEVLGRLTADGDLRGRLVLAAEGPAATSFRSVFVAVSPDERERRLRDWLTRRWPQVAIDSCRLVSGAAPHPQIEIAFTLPGIARPAGGAWLVTPSLMSAWSSPPPRDSTRSTPVDLGAREDVDERWDVELPVAGAADAAAPVEWHDAFVDYASSCRSSGNRLTLTRRLAVRSAVVPAGDFGEARRLWRAIWSGDHPSILVAKP